MALLAPQIRFARVFLILLGMVIIIFNLWPAPYRAVLRKSQPVLNKFDAIRNETLGFEKIFVLNLPSRTDKRDNIILGSSICDFRIDFLDGVDPEQISPKTYPYNWNPDHLPTEYASRRAHVNAIQRTVEERLGSSLIIEDDADWDVSIKAQLQSFAHAVRSLQGTGTNEPASPYGDDWDVLWPGHCGLECKTDLAYHLAPNDPTVPQPRHFLPYWRDPPPIDRPDHARMTCIVKDAVCASFYAVSYRGAQRILAALSVNPSGIAEEIDIGAQIDVALGRMCGHGYLQCFSPYPALTGCWRSAGTSKGSDIHNTEGEVAPAASWGVLYSTMLNINRILRGERTVHSTWDDAPVPDIASSEISMQEGSVYIRGERVEMFV